MMKPRPVQRLTTLMMATVLVIGLMSLDAQAQSRLKVIKLRPITGSLTLSARWQEQNYGTVDSQSDMYREYLRINTRGSLIHEKMFDFSLITTVMYTDYEFRNSRSPDYSSDEWLYGYNFQGTFLKDKDYPLTIHSYRLYNYQDQPFLPSTRVETSNDGFDWRYHKDQFSTYLSGEKEKRIQQNYRDMDSDIESDITRWSLGAEWSIDENDFLVQYDYQEAYNSLSTVRSRAETLFGQHTIRFGNRRQYSLASSVRNTEFRGGNSQSILTWYEQLLMTHTPDFRTYYTYNYESKEIQFPGTTVESEINTFESGVRHKLYESLFTNANVSFQRQDYGTFDRDHYSAQVDVAYKKKNPWGVLGINVGQGYSYTQSTFHNNTGPVAVLDENHAFADPFPIVISRPNIQSGSVVITDSTGIIIYLPGNDYTISTMSDRIEITRVVTGAIADGQSVLIDYTYQPINEYESSVDSTTFGISHAFRNGLSLYYNYHDSNYHISPPSIIDYSSEDHTFGSAFRRWRMYSKYEYRIHNSRYPYHSQSANIGADLAYVYRHSTNASATWTLINHETSSRDVELFEIQLNNRWKLTENAYLDGTLRYRDQTDTLNGDETGTDYTLRFSLNRRKTRFSILASTKTYDTVTKSEFNEIRVEVTRRF